MVVRMRKNEKVVKHLANAMINLFNDEMTEEVFIHEYKSLVRSYFNNISKIEINYAHDLLLKLSHYIENYELINNDWLLKKTFSILYTKVYLPEGTGNKMYQLSVDYFERTKGGN